MDATYADIWKELNKEGYDINDEVIPFVIFNEACELTGFDADFIMNEFSNVFDIDIG